MSFGQSGGPFGGPPRDQDPGVGGPFGGFGPWGGAPDSGGGASDGGAGGASSEAGGPATTGTPAGPVRSAVATTSRAPESASRCSSSGSV